MDVPSSGETFHDNVPSPQRVKIGRDRIDYEGHSYTKERMDNASHAVINCIRHSSILPLSPSGWCYLSAVAYILCLPLSTFVAADRPTRVALQ